MAHVFFLLLFSLSLQPLDFLSFTHSFTRSPFTSLLLTSLPSHLFTLVFSHFKGKVELPVAQIGFPSTSETHMISTHTLKGVYSHTFPSSSLPPLKLTIFTTPIPAKPEVRRLGSHSVSFTNWLHGCVTWAKSLNLSGLQFPPSQQRPGYQFTFKEMITFLCSISDALR